MKVLSTGNFKPYWKSMLLAGGITAWSLPAWNFFVNPYQIFKPTLLGERYTASTTNERYLKTDFLLKTADKNLLAMPETILAKINADKPGMEIRNSANRQLPNAFIVGSSIMGMIAPDILDRHFAGQHFYNLAFLAAKPDEILLTLQALRRGGVSIKTLIYGLEPIAFTDVNTYGPAHKLHPEAIRQNKTRMVFDYFFAPSLQDGLSHVLNVMRGIPSVRYDIEWTGSYALLRYEQEIQADHLVYMRKHFPENEKLFIAPPFLSSRFADLDALIQWTKAEHIETHVYLNPLHPYVADSYGAERLADFKRKVSDLIGQTLSDCTNLLNDEQVNTKFYDYKHFRPSESSKVIACGLGV